MTLLNLEAEARDEAAELAELKRVGAGAAAQ